ncbi:breast carcinoma-amplified sequence 1 [Poecilia formosa]|uniref:breast carcinoma-amplified sequence 1 n=1 Tax=Poecilia formosa TaxID=48698 RepID=UPI0007B8C1FB|nr:PREDICTED: breast carcinoma-amplified sequence 1 [Poecilia formosa]
MGNEQSAPEEVTEVKENGTIPEKHENGSVNGISASITLNGLEADVKSDITVHQNGKLQSPKLETKAEANNVTAEPEPEPAPAESVSETTDSPPANTEPVKKRKEKSHGFGKLFKKKDRKADEKTEVREKEKISSEEQVDASQLRIEPQQETANVKQESEPVTEPEVGATSESSPEEQTVPASENGNDQPEESREESEPEENPVMNFFKTLVTPTKTPKKETAAPDAAKDQSQKETTPAEATTVAQTSEQSAAPKGMPAPPPPPPEPPRLETKGEPASKAAKPTQKDEPKASAKEPESAKGKSTKDALSKFFRPKTIKEEAHAIEVEVQPVVEVQETAVEEPEPLVEVQVESQQAAVEVGKQVGEEEKVDPSKAGTLEAAAKPEPPPPVQEEKKLTSKSSFMFLFKPKVLLDTMATKVQAASTSGVRLLKKSTGLAADPKKTTPTPPSPAESPQPAKAKEEPKAVAKSEAVVDSKPAAAASPAGDDAASQPKKLEKRNSIQLFFKNLGQKRHSTDAGVQTEPATAATASEKTK